MSTSAAGRMLIRPSTTRPPATTCTLTHRAVRSRAAGSIRRCGTGSAARRRAVTSRRRSPVSGFRRGTTVRGRSRRRTRSTPALRPAARPRRPTTGRRRHPARRRPPAASPRQQEDRPAVGRRPDQRRQNATQPHAVQFARTGGRPPAPSRPPSLSFDLPVTQPSTAVRAGMTQPALSRLEAGAVIPTIPLLERVSAAALDADLIVQIAPHAAIEAARSGKS